MLHLVSYADANLISIKLASLRGVNESPAGGGYSSSNLTDGCLNVVIHHLCCESLNSFGRVKNK